MAGRHTHPASHEQLAAKLSGGVVERKLLTAQMVDRRIALQVEEQVVGEADLPGLLLEHRAPQKSISNEQETPQNRAFPTLIPNLPSLLLPVQGP